MGSAWPFPLNVLFLVIAAVELALDSSDVSHQVKLPWRLQVVL